jgi:hypothetical protein
MAHLTTLSPEGVSSIEMQLRSGILFNSQHFHLQPHHPLLVALKQGFNYPLINMGPEYPFTEVCVLPLVFVTVLYICPPDVR